MGLPRVQFRRTLEGIFDQEYPGRKNIPDSHGAKCRRPLANGTPRQKLEHRRTAFRSRQPTFFQQLRGPIDTDKMLVPKSKAHYHLLPGQFRVLLPEGLYTSSCHVESQTGRRMIWPKTTHHPLQLSFRPMASHPPAHDAGLLPNVFLRPPSAPHGRASSDCTAAVDRRSNTELVVIPNQPLIFCANACIGHGGDCFGYLAFMPVQPVNGVIGVSSLRYCIPHV